MNNTNEINKTTTLGRPGTQDGNIGAMVAPANLCSEARSINLRMNSLRDSGFPLTRTLPTQNESQPGGSSSLGQAQPGNTQCPQQDKEDSNESDEEVDNTIENLKRDKIFEKEIRNNLIESITKYGRKQGIKIASMNIRGRNDQFHKSKFKNTTTMIRRERIAILAIQETKMKPGEEIQIMEANPGITYINNSIGNEQQGAGTGFVLNKELMRDREWKHTILIPGRLSRLEVKWSEGQTLDIVNAYMPNEVCKKIDCLTKMKEEIENINNWNEPILMGDWNFVEGKIDRLPEHEDNEEVLKKWGKIKKHLNLYDGWRAHNPTTLEYTYHQKGTGSASRIDRIYLTKKVIKETFDWEITQTGVNTDHDMVSVKILKTKMPYIGSGIPRVYQDTIEYAPFRKKAKAALMRAQKEMKNYNETKLGDSPQVIWGNIKREIKKTAQAEAEDREERKSKRKWDIKEKIDLCIDGYKITEEKVWLNRKNTKRDELGKWERGRLLNQQKNAEARYRREGEKMTKYWFGIGKKPNEREVILGLRNKEGRLKQETKEMVKIAEEYHQELQKRQPRTREEKEEIKNMTKELEVELNDEEKDQFKTPITREEIREALKKAENGKAPGKDGIPYEFYKSWKEPDNEYEKKTEPDIIGILQMVYNDIERNGLKERSFNDGAMCLIFKKKDRLQIENYRPITLTNTDYKILTKTIAYRLGKVAGKLIGEDQAGFVPGRGLYDNTKLTQMMIDYCEQEEENGCIVSLDQEKAYDKIAHDYLWEVLQKFNFPGKFIDLVKELYKNARTTVVLNGVKSKGIKIERGVRQGCPMSCLLYDLAIEPLACAIRNSKLKGIVVPRPIDRVIVSLFADDTLVYLSENDDLQDLQKIISKFCKASKARFNIAKTEYLPIGSKKHREEMIKTRKLNNKLGNEIDKETKIIKEGQTMRTLGAWVGNGANQDQQWDQIIEKQNSVMENWKKMRPSLRGKELLLKALVQSRALFLATVNGIPSEIQRKMNRNMRDFLWDGKRGKVNWKEATRRRIDGGLGIPDIEARAEAIQIMWIKKYLTTEKRPKWAYIMDHIIGMNVARKPVVDEKSKVTWILQTWHESEASWNKVPQGIKEMLKVGRKYNIGMDAAKISKETKGEMPLWHHIAASDNYGWNKKAARCLRENHKVMTVKDLQNEKEAVWEGPSCKNPEACMAMAGKLIGKISDKFNPEKETPHRDNLDHTPRRVQRNMKGNIEEEELEFNPEITARGHPLEEIRILGPKVKYKTRKAKDKALQRKPAYRKRRRTGEEEEITLYTDGSSTKNGAENSKGGAGIWHEEDSLFNKAIRIPGKGITNQKAEIVAIMEAVRLNLTAKMTIKSDSKTVLEGIVKHHKKWEDNDWLNIENRKEWEELIYRLRQRTGETKFKWIKGHDGIEGNEMADKLADEGTKKETEDVITYYKKKNFVVEGARLAKMTQSKAYHLIQRKKKKGENRKKEENIENTKDEIERISGYRPNTKQIWKGMQNKEIKNKINDWLWTAMHERVRCGKYFEKIPGLEERQYCKCGEIESLEHILLDCQENETEMVWKLAKETWEKVSPQGKEWPPPTIGLIRGLGTMSLPLDEKEDENEEQAKRIDQKMNTRRYRAIASEAAWMIWKIRNKRLFQEIAPNWKKTTEEWLDTIRRKIEIDFTIVMQEDFSRRKKEIETFTATWCNSQNTVEVEEKTGKHRLKINF